MKFHRGVRFRLAAIYTVIIVATLAGFSVYQYFALWGEMLDNLDGRLRDEFEDFHREGVLTAQSMAKYAKQISAQNAKVPLQPAVFVQFADTAGRPLASSNNVPEGDTLASKRGFRLALIASEVTESIVGKYEYPIRVLSTRMKAEDGSEVVFELGVSIRRLIFTTRGFLQNLITASGVLTLLSLIVGWWMAKRSLRPVHNIIETTRIITAERLQERLSPTGSGDEIDELILTLNHMIARLEAAFRQISQFTADVSHELRTPLAVMRGEIEVALQYSKSEEELKGVLVSMLEEVDRLSGIANDLLLLARADAGLDMKRFDKVNLGQLLAEVADDVKLLAESRGVVLKSGDLQDTVLLGDRDGLRRIFMNLLDNAVKYTPSGGQVRLSCVVRDGAARISVEDNGVGIGPEDVPHLFDRFYKTSRSRTQTSDKGAGLGLSIARSLVEKHGGTISVQSALGRGTTFTVLLPLLPGEKSGPSSA
jgi:heavy metal sensor kinase